MEMSMSYKILPLSVACFILLLLTACGKEAKTPTDSAKSTSASSNNSLSKKSIGSNEEQAIKKMNAYVKAHNGLIGMFYSTTKGLKGLLKDYEAQNIPQKTKVDANTRLTLYLNVSILKNTLNSLSESKEFKGNGETSKLESIADRMLTNGNLLFVKGSDIENYFKSKKYLEDNLGKAKAEHTEFVRLWQTFIADSDAFSDELDTVERARRIAAIKKLRAEGNNRLAANEEAMLASSEILALFEEKADFKNAAKIQSANTLALQLEKVTNEIKTENDKIQDAKSTSYTRVYEKMNSFMGAYRTVKATGQSREFEEMVRHYNSAVSEQKSLN